MGKSVQNQKKSKEKSNPENPVIPAQAGEVVHGCTVYGPKDGIQ